MNRLMSFARTAACAAAVAVAPLAEAQTFSELQAAVDAAESGSTVYVENDMTFDAPLAVADGKTITLEGRDGVVTLSRDAGYKAGLFFQVPEGTTAHLTIRNLVLDLKCNSAQVILTDRVVCIDSDKGSFTLGAGAKVRDACLSAENAGCLFTRWGQLIMEDGSEISHIYHYSYGVAVLAGWNSSGLFKMNGGLITDCHGIANEGWDEDFGAAVYVWGGRFFFNGGLITGNESPHYVGGVAVTKGSGGLGRGVLYLGGHGAITGNVGRVANDVYCGNDNDNIWIMNDVGDMPHATVCDGATLTFRSPKAAAHALGEFAKCCTLRSSRRTNTPYPGMGCISSQDDPTLVCGGSFGESTSVYYPTWQKKAGVTSFPDGRTYARAALSELFDKTQKDATHGLKATVAISDDLVYDGTEARGFANGTDILLTSEGDRHAIKMPDGATHGFMSLSDGGSTVKKVRLENIVIDGNRQGGARMTCDSNGAGGLFRLQRGGELTLGKGAKVCNVQPSSGSGVAYAVSESFIRMEEGAEITDCHGTWGSAFVLGQGPNVTSKPVFEMTGGRITGCTCTYAGTSDGMGGVVYLWGATMNMSGGEISGNVAPTAGTGGIHLENGSGSTLNLSGTARIAGNTGPHPDIFKRSGNTIVFSGDFRGLVAIADNSPSADVSASSGATGAWCFYRSSNDPAVDKTQWGYLDGGGTTLKWGSPVGTIDEYGFVQTSDIDIRLSDPEDLSTAEARAKLPHVLGGAALNGNMAQTLTFDSQDMLASGDLPLCLYAFAGGDFAGTASFTTPVEGKLRWKVSKQTVGGVRGLYLERDPFGFAIFLR